MIKGIVTMKVVLAKKPKIQILQNKFTPTMIKIHKFSPRIDEIKISHAQMHWNSTYTAIMAIL